MSPMCGPLPTLLAWPLASDSRQIGGKSKHHAAHCVPACLSEVTPSFIEEALRLGGVLPAGVNVAAVSLEHVAVQGLLSTTGRAKVTYLPSNICEATPFWQPPRPLPPTVIVKLQAENEENRMMAIGSDNYATEASAYKNFTKDMVVGTPACFHIAHDAATGNYVFVMEDLTLCQGLYPVSQFDGNACNRSEAEAVAHALAKLHAQFWITSGSVSPLLRQTHEFECRDVAFIVQRDGEKFLSSAYCARMDASTRAVVSRVMPKAADLMAALRMGPQTLLHHDCRADNIFWGHQSAPAGVVLLDWQLIGQGVGALDLAWFAAGSFLDSSQPDCMAKHRSLVEVYWQSLIEAGVDASKFSFEAAWRDYILGMIWSFLIIVQVVNFGPPNPMLIEFVKRHTTSLMELDAENVTLERLAL